MVDLLDFHDPFVRYLALHDLLALALAAADLQRSAVDPLADYGVGLSFGRWID